MECYKCHGKGVIEGYLHICEGRCFMCNGSGSIPDKKAKNIGFSRMVLNSYDQPGHFPADLKAASIRILSDEGHPTRERHLLKDESFYYIGQPVARSDWRKIPIAEMPIFAEHYKRVTKEDFIY